MYFSEYGYLQPICNRSYLTGPWKYLSSAYGSDGTLYDVVIQDGYPCKLAYTLINPYEEV